MRRDGDIAPYRQAARGVRTAMGYGNGTTRWGMAMRAHNMGHGNGGEWTGLAMHLAIGKDFC